MDALRAIEHRHSVRSYRPDEVEKDKVEKLLKAANNAPCAGPFHLTVLLNKEILQNLDHLTRDAMLNSGNHFLVEIARTEGFKPLYDAPAMLICSSPDENPYGGQTCAAAAATAAIAAVDMGLGACYMITPTLALQTHKEICDKIGVPAGFKPLCCLIFGYSGNPEKGRMPRKTTDNTNCYK